MSISPSPCIVPTPSPFVVQDGYAVVAADGAGEFPVVGEARAGAAQGMGVSLGSVTYITTGVLGWCAGGRGGD